MVVVDPNTVVRTERLLLRPLTIEDVEDVHLMRKDPEVMKHTSIPASNDIEKTKAWIHGCHRVPNNWNFSIELLTSHSHPRVIGLIGAVRAPEVGYMFNSSYWGNGYATEALRAFMPLFFAHYSAPKSASELARGASPSTVSGAEHFMFAEAHADTELVASHNVLRKAGFELFEKRERDFENPTLGWRDSLVFRMQRVDGDT